MLDWRFHDKASLLHPVLQLVDRLSKQLTQTPGGPVPVLGSKLAEAQVLVAPLALGRVGGDLNPDKCAMVGAAGELCVGVRLVTP